MSFSSGISQLNSPTCTLHAHSFLFYVHSLSHLHGKTHTHFSLQTHIPMCFYLFTKTTVCPDLILSGPHNLQPFLTCLFYKEVKFMQSFFIYTKMHTNLHFCAIIPSPLCICQIAQTLNTRVGCNLILLKNVS